MEVLRMFTTMRWDLLPELPPYHLDTFGHLGIKYQNSILPQHF